MLDFLGRVFVLERKGMLTALASELFSKPLLFFSFSVDPLSDTKDDIDADR
jgi:hypothetical protein